MTQNTFELTIDSIANGGYGVGMRGRQPVFVPYTIPGERLIARPVEQAERHTFAEGVKLLDASADRVYPVCPHFGPGRCGRCQWQHIGYEAQLLLKQDILADQLGRLGGLSDHAIEAALRPVIASPEQWGYNAHMTFSVTSDGKLAFPGTGQTFGLPGKTLFPIEVCHILHPDLLDLYDQLDLDLQGIKRVKLQIGGDGARMIVLSLAQDEAPELETDLPASINVLLPDNEPMNLIGDSHLHYTINGQDFRVTAGSTFRANLSQLPALVSTVDSLLDLKDGETLLDLYAGVGVYSAFAAPKASLVTLVESYPPAVTDADENLADFDNVDVIEGSVEEVLTTLDDAYNAAIVDPGSRGLSKEAVDGLVASQAARIVYVSDDPASLARDTKRLVQQGYRLAAAQPLDFAPQTYYLETAALFVRR
ncbi:MAG: class I SAM-dependent RNA methyltransferase [Anaerolineae bacterium]|nr:class I SAM-dependent RNA methyltransferase [Anaerolineae bacterium]